MTTHHFVAVAYPTPTCLKCGNELMGGPVYADLNGPAYVAYYCGKCAERMAKVRPGSLADPQLAVV